MFVLKGLFNNKAALVFFFFEGWGVGGGGVGGGGGGGWVGGGGNWGQAVLTHYLNQWWPNLLMYISGIILWMRPANERRRYIVTSFIGWGHTQNYPWYMHHSALIS